MDTKLIASHAYLSGYMRKEAGVLDSMYNTAADAGDWIGKQTDRISNAAGKMMAGDSKEVASLKEDNSKMLNQLVGEARKRAGAETNIAGQAAAMAKPVIEANDAKNKEELKKYIAMALGGGALVGGGAMALSRPAPKKKKKQIEE